MLLCIRSVRSSYSHVTNPYHRVTRGCKTTYSSFTTNAFLRRDIGPDDQPSQVDPTELVDEPDSAQGEYISLTSKLHHYPTHTIEPEYKATQQPLSTLLPPSPSSNHSSQHTFLAHSRRTGLNPASTTYTGTRYEYLTLSSLQRLGIELTRKGGTGDKGVDLVGFWHLPQWQHSVRTDSDTDQNGPEKANERLRVVVQCKRISTTTKGSKAVGPSVVRELEGAFRGAPSGWRSRESTVGILVSTKAATKGVIESMRRSESALAWVLLEEIDDEAVVKDAAVNAADATESQSSLEEEHGRGEAESNDTDPPSIPTTANYNPIRGRIRQILWNQKAKDLGLEGLDVVKRYGRDDEDEVVLMWKGRAVQGLSADKRQD